MKPSVIIVVSVSLLLGLAPTAKTQKASPSPSPRRSVAAESSPADKKASAPAKPEDLAVPMEAAPAPMSTPAASSNQSPPKPILYLTSATPYSTGGKNFIRYRYDVFNKMEYPADMFAAAPTLPPCGSNTNASRTWVDFFDSTGRRLYGFCALGKPEDLGKIWFALEEGVLPPSYVYIELNDRQTNTKYKSNLADTTL
jgi:hypothetical protein